MYIPKHQYNIFLAEVRQSKFYKRLTKRTFRKHHNYPDYKQVAAQIASHLATANVGVRQMRQDDVTYNNNLAAMWLAYNNPIFPVFAVEKDLCEALLNTDLPTHVCSLNQAFKTALFLFPSNLFKNPDIQVFDWAFVSHLLPSDPERTDRAEYLKFLASMSSGFNVGVRDITDIGDGHPVLSWSSTLADHSIYNSGVALPEGGLRPVRGGLHFAFPVDQDRETKFVEGITEIILKILLYMQIQRDRTPKKAVAPGVTRLHSAGFSRNAPQDFIWLGSDYQKARSKKPHQGGTHTSPKTHWRRGHIRALTVKNTEEERLIWIQPTIVNG